MLQQFPSEGTKGQSQFNCAKTTFSLIFAFLACGALSALLAFWIIKGSNQINSFPYVFSGSCSEPYFIVKYNLDENKVIPNTIFASIVAGLTASALMVIFNLYLLIKKIRPSACTKGTMVIFASLAVLSSIVSTGFAASFLLQLPRLQIYSCQVTYSLDTLILLSGLAAGALVLSIVVYILTLAHQSEIGEDGDDKKLLRNYEYEIANLTNVSDAPMNKFETSLSRPENMRENTSFAELKSPHNQSRPGAAKVENTQTSYQRENRQKIHEKRKMEQLKTHQFKMEEPEPYIWKASQSPQSKAKLEKSSLPRTITSRLKSEEVEVKPKYNPILYESQLSQEGSVSNAQIFFVPEQSFAYPNNSKIIKGRRPRQTRTENKQYNLAPYGHSKSSKLGTPYGVAADFVRMQEEQDPIERVVYAGERPNPRLMRAISQIRKNYQRKLNNLQKFY